MTDIEIAKKLIQTNQFTLAIVREGKPILISNDRGIKPLFTAITKIRDKLQSASVADKVVGRAAAMLYQYANIKELYAHLLSENANNILEKTNIDYNWGNLVPYIKNHDQTGLCPIEKLSLEIDHIDTLLERLAEFLDLSVK